MLSNQLNVPIDDILQSILVATMKTDDIVSEPRRWNIFIEDFQEQVLTPYLQELESEHA